MNLRATTYACGTPERAILDEYRRNVSAALRKAGAGALYIDGLSVETIRAIARDRGLEAVVAESDAAYLRAVCTLAETRHSAPNARPVHT